MPHCFLRFDHSTGSSRVEIPGNTDFNVGSDAGAINTWKFVLSMWVRPLSSAPLSRNPVPPYPPTGPSYDYYFLWHRGNAQNWGNLRFFAKDENTLCLTLIQQPDFVYNIEWSLGFKPLKYDLWNHICLVGHTNRTITLYVNGNMVGSTPLGMITGNLVQTSASYPTVIGNLAAGDEGYPHLSSVTPYDYNGTWSGDIDEVWLATGLEWTSDQVRDYYNKPDDLYFTIPDESVALYHFDEGTGSATDDEIGTNNGNIYDCTWYCNDPIWTSLPYTPVSIQATLNPKVIVRGDTSTITWATSNAATVVSSYSPSLPSSVSWPYGIGLPSSLGLSGSEVVCPRDTTVYWLQAANSYASIPYQTAVKSLFLHVVPSSADLPYGGEWDDNGSIHKIFITDYFNSRINLWVFSADNGFAEWRDAIGVRSAHSFVRMATATHSGTYVGSCRESLFTTSNKESSGIADHWYVQSATERAEHIKSFGKYTTTSLGEPHGVAIGRGVASGQMFVSHYRFPSNFIAKYGVNSYECQLSNSARAEVGLVLHPSGIYGCAANGNTLFNFLTSDLSIWNTKSHWMSAGAICCDSQYLYAVSQRDLNKFTIVESDGIPQPMTSVCCVGLTKYHNDICTDGTYLWTLYCDSVSNYHITRWTCESLTIVDTVNPWKFNGLNEGWQFQIPTCMTLSEPDAVGGQDFYIYSITKYATYSKEHWIYSFNKDWYMQNKVGMDKNWYNDDIYSDLCYPDRIGGFPFYIWYHTRHAYAFGLWSSNPTSSDILIRGGYKSKDSVLDRLRARYVINTADRLPADQFVSMVQDEDHYYTAILSDMYWSGFIAKIKKFPTGDEQRIHDCFTMALSQTNDEEMMRQRVVLTTSFEVESGTGYTLWYNYTSLALDYFGNKLYAADWWENTIAKYDTNSLTRLDYIVVNSFDVEHIKFYSPYLYACGRNYLRLYNANLEEVITYQNTIYPNAWYSCFDGYRAGYMALLDSENGRFEIRDFKFNPYPSVNSFTHGNWGRSENEFYFRGAGFNNLMWVYALQRGFQKCTDLVPQIETGDTPSPKQFGNIPFHMMKIEMGTLKICITNSDKPITYNGDTYIRAYIEVPPVARGTRFFVGTIQLKASNVYRDALPVILSQLIGSPVTIYKAYWSGDEHSLPYIYFDGLIESLSATEGENTADVSITIGNEMGRWKRDVPNCTYSGNCNWIYKSPAPGCEYRDDWRDLGMCKRNWEDCKDRANTHRFRGFRHLVMQEEAELWWGRVEEGPNTGIQDQMPSYMQWLSKWLGELLYDEYWTEYLNRRYGKYGTEDYEKFYHL